MMFKTCPSCGGDLSAVTVKRNLFGHFWMKVVRCPLCRRRTTLLTRRKFLGSKPARRLRGSFGNDLRWGDRF
jgi:hypothetical protein